MDKTKHSDLVIVLTYGLMAFCWAGKNLLDFKDMIICGVSGLMLGAVTVMAEKTKMPTYICRSIGTFAAALLIIQVYCFSNLADGSAMAAIGSMVPPVATGARFIEGLCLSSTKNGRDKIVTAWIVSLFLAAAVFAAVHIAEWRGVAL